MPTITKQHLIKYLTEALPVRGDSAKKFVDTLFETLQEAIIEGNRIEIRGFGSWMVKATKAKPEARNPKTGAKVYVPARRKVMFKPGKMLKKELGRPREHV